MGLVMGLGGGEGREFFKFFLMMFATAARAVFLMRGNFCVLGLVLVLGFGCGARRFSIEEMVRISLALFLVW